MVIITDWDTNFTMVVLPNLSKTSLGYILVGNHAVIFTELIPPTSFRSVMFVWTMGIHWGKKKPINIKNFSGTPPGVRPVCPGDTSHLSRDMSRLSRGHSVPLVLIYTSIRPKCPGCPWDVPSLSLGRLRGIPTTKFLYVIFLYRFFCLSLIQVQIKQNGKGKSIT